MGSNVLPSQLREWHRRCESILVLALLLMAVHRCSSSVTDGPLGDEIREDITLEEARQLAPFEICLPTYLPSGIEPVPHITYHADFGDPMESDIRLQYYSSDDRRLIIEVVQRHMPGAVSPEHLAENVRSFYVQSLLAWAVNRGEVDHQTRATVTVDVDRYRDEDLLRWSFELLVPTSLRANMVLWGNDPVDYEIYSRLPIEQAKRVLQSIPDISSCDAGSTPGP